MAIVESNVETIWWAKQTAKGTVATTATKRGRKVAGTMIGTNVAYGSEDFSDGNRFATASDFVDTIEGGGAPAIQAQSGPFAHLAWLMLGAETVTGTDVPYTHVITPGAQSAWTTWWTRLGSSLVMRKRHADCRISQLVLEGSSGQKVLRATPTIMSLDPGEIIAADPAVADDGTEPLNYNECEGTFTVNGTVIRGHSAFTITITDDLTIFRGDSPRGIDMAPGRGNITLASTILLDTDGLAQYNLLRYGTTTPTAGTKPVTTVPALGTYEFTATKSANESIKVKFYGVRWTPPDEPSGSPSGGVLTLALNGGGRVVGSNPMIEITVINGDVAYSA